MLAPSRRARGPCVSCALLALLALPLLLLGTATTTTASAALTFTDAASLLSYAHQTAESPSPCADAVRAAEDIMAAFSDVALRLEPAKNTSQHGPKSKPHTASFADRILAEAGASGRRGQQRTLALVQGLFKPLQTALFDMCGYNARQVKESGRYHQQHAPPSGSSTSEQQQQDVVAVRRSRRNSSSSTDASSFQCSLSGLIATAANSNNGDNEDGLFADACEPFQQVQNISTLVLTIDRETGTLPEFLISSLNAALPGPRFARVNLFIGVTSWRSVLLQLLTIPQWPQSVRLLDIRTSNEKPGPFEEGSLPSNSFARFSGLNWLQIFHSGVSGLETGIFNALTLLFTLVISDTQIQSLDVGLFASLHRLRTLQLFGNSIKAFQPGQFDSQIQVMNLQLTNNQLTSLPAGLFDRMTSLSNVNLQRNQLQTLPVNLFRNHPQLRSIVLSSNRLQSLPIRTFSGLVSLRRLAIDDNPGLALPAAAFSDLAQLTQVNIRGITLSDDVDVIFASRIGHWSLETFQLGWEELNEDVLSIGTICSLLSSSVNRLEMVSSSYQRFEGCQGVAIAQIILRDSAQLSSVRLTGDSTDLLDVSNCPNLVSLESTSVVATADVSGTSLAVTGQLCRQIGSVLLLAQNLKNADAVDAGELLHQCFEHGQAFDFSHNGNHFSNLAVLQSATPQRVVIGEQAFPARFADTGATAHFRSSVPVFINSDQSIQCNVDFELAPLTFGLLVPTFSTICDCAGGFHAGDDAICVETPIPRQPVVAIAVGTAIAFTLLTLAVQFAVRWLRRKQRERYLLLEENELQERLLSEATEEVAALKQGWQIAIDEVGLVSKVDEGAFGEVWKGEWDGIAVAIKFLKLASAGMLDQFMLADIAKEVDFLQRTRHPNLVRFFGTGTDKHGAPFLVLEFVDLGSLKHLLFDQGLDEAIQQARRRSRSSTSSMAAAERQDDLVDEDGFVNVSKNSGELLQSTFSRAASSSTTKRLRDVASLKLCLVQDIADGMAFLHSINVMHRDLKSGNVLVNKRLVAKITDFGSMSGKLAKIQSASSATISGVEETNLVDDVRYGANNLSSTLGLTMTAGVGTPLYMAPEILDPHNRRLSLKADTFSFGVLMWEIYECKVPDLIEQELGDDFNGFLLQTLFRLYSAGKSLRFTGSDDGGAASMRWFRQLSQRCMALDASARPSFEEIQKCIEGKTDSLEQVA